MTHVYKSPRTVQGAAAVILTLLVLFIVVVLVFSGSSIQRISEAAGLFVLLYGALVFGVALSRIEIDRDHNTICYRNGVVRSQLAPIGNIIQIGYPQQTYLQKSLNAFIYIWYDDPQTPGRDRYIQIRNTQFDPHTIAMVVDEVRHINPKIKLDAEMTRLVGEPQT